MSGDTRTLEAAYWQGFHAARKHYGINEVTGQVDTTPPTRERMTVERLASELAVARNGGDNIEERVADCAEVFKKAPEAYKPEMRCARRALELLQPQAGEVEYFRLAKCEPCTISGHELHCGGCCVEEQNRLEHQNGALRNALQIQEAANVELGRGLARKACGIYVERLEALEPALTIAHRWAEVCKEKHRLLDEVPDICLVDKAALQAVKTELKKVSRELIAALDSLGARPGAGGEGDAS